MPEPKSIALGDFQIANDRPIALISGPCQAEGEQHSVDIAGTLAEACRAEGVGYVFKASFDKANRTSLSGKRGLGLEAGLGVLAAVKSAIGCPVLTDIHLPEQCAPVAE
ncbi:MAG: 3-deoxy-8-phosphooctulonate synthase, partial [Pseudomonadota bacterium]